MQLNQALSQRIKQLIKDKEWKGYKLSTKSAVCTSTISNILLCKSKSCTLATLLNICRGFNITLEQFFTSDLFSPSNLDDN